MRRYWRMISFLAVLAVSASCGDDEAGPVEPGDTDTALSVSLRPVTGNSQYGVVGTALAEPLVVRVTGPAQQPLAGVTVFWEAAPGAGSVSPATTESDGSGLARTWWTLGNQAVEQHAKARTEEDGVSLSFRAFGRAAAPATMEFLDDGDMEAFEGAVVEPAVLVQDAFGNLADSAVVRFSVVSGDGWLTDSIAATDSEGVARTRWYMGPDGAIPNVLRAQADTLAAELSITAMPAVAGRLVIVGGGLASGNEAVYREIIEAQQGEGRVCVVPTASASLESATSSMETAVTRINDHGGPGTAKGVLISVDNPEAADDPEIVAKLAGCSGYFFTGGIQTRIVNVFEPGGVATPALEAIRERHRVGAVMSGSSAGAAMMSHPMISGGSSAGALDTGVAGGGVRVVDGLGFFQGAAIDQHFLARGRLGRLLVAVLQVDAFPMGFGIDENTALVVVGDSVRTVGASGVVIVEGQDAVSAATGNGGTGLVLYLMGPGDSYRPEYREMVFQQDKFFLPESPDEPALPADLFEGWEFLHLLEDFGRSVVTEISAEVEGYVVEMRKMDGFQARSGVGQGVEGSAYGLGMGPIEIDILQIPGS